LDDVSDLEVIGAFTNMVFITVPKDRLSALASHMHTQGIKLSASNSRIRLVLHLDINDQDLVRIVEAFRSF